MEGFFGTTVTRGISRRLSRRRRLKFFNFFRPSAAAAKKLLGNRRRLEIFLFSASAAEIFKDLLKKFLSFEKFSHKKPKNDN